MNGQKIRTVKAALTTAAEADNRAQKLIRELFPAGSRVKWMHGDNVRSGTVRDSCGSNVRETRFSIESESGRTCWIGAYRLLSFAESEHEEWMRRHGDELKMWTVLCHDIGAELHVVARSLEDATSLAQRHFDGTGLSPASSNMTCKLSKMVEGESWRADGEGILSAKPTPVAELLLKSVRSRA